MALRVLVVDDSVIFRKIIGDVLSALPNVEVVGVASNGKTALARLPLLKPDLITLDIEMPEMNGLEVLEAIRSQGLEVGAIVLSAFTRHGSDLTIRALELGAFDFIPKVVDGDLEQNRAALEKVLAPLIKAYAQRREIQSILRGSAMPRPSEIKSAGVSEDLSGVTRRMQQVASKPRAEMVLIGVSTGGPNALAQVIPQLPADLDVPVLIVQHMPALFTRSLADSLKKHSSLMVKEAESGELVLPNCVYIAPGGRQMKVMSRPDGRPIVQITDDPPENNCRPAVDYLFRSAAYGFPGRACAVIMTGMGNDGTLGLRLLRRNPCWVIAQDEASCVVYGMPKEAVAAGVVDISVPLDQIAAEIRKAVKGF